MEVAAEEGLALPAPRLRHQRKQLRRLRSTSPARTSRSHASMNRAFHAPLSAPLALLQALLPRLLGSGEAAGMLLQPLLDALQTTDAASATAVELAAELALAHSDHVLPDVISLLDSAVAAQRSNALAILASAARLCTAADVSGARIAAAWPCEHRP